jgi:hypothetical protein
MSAENPSSLERQKSKSRNTWWVLALVCLASAGAYLLASRLVFRNGFPLDDAWIHQTYARNLALRGEWAFIPGKVSGGSTSPLWSALLAPGFWVRLGPLVWAYLLGTAALWGLAMTGEMTVRKLAPAYSPRFPWAGTAIALEWHLTWAAVSGMETLLYAMLAGLVLFLVISNSRKYFGLGLLAGLTVWIRPDGLTLLGPAGFALLLSLRDWRSRLRGLLQLFLGFGSVFALYLLFNLVVTDSPWPNTFYAKQAEYAVYLQKPFLERLGAEALQPMIGAGIILLAGFLLVLIKAIRKREWGTLAAILWLAGFLGLYAWRLPVTYQHGRYVIPAMPIYFCVGLAGIAGLLPNPRHMWERLGTVFWRLTTATVLLFFWGRGAYAYAQDVAVIESEMVSTARWVAENVPPGNLVAAHDIGALGYYGKHDLVDLAGLVSPEVIPFLRNEGRIAAYLDEKGVAYLVTFPDWYPQLVNGRELVYSSQGKFAPAFGEMNMAVYRWP